MSTFGPAYDPEIDGKRIDHQMTKIRDYMSDANWRTLQQIALTLGIPEASVSAQLRHLRKEKFGGYRVDKKRVGMSGLWSYQVLPPLPIEPSGQMTLL